MLGMRSCRKLKNESVEIDSPISFGGGYVARIGFVVIDGVNILFWFYYRERDENGEGN